jgi:hypothetical protein
MIVDTLSDEKLAGPAAEPIAWLAFVPFPPDGGEARYEVADPNEDDAFPVYDAASLDGLRGERDALKALSLADVLDRALAAEASLTTARADGIEVERLREALELHQIWLRAALDCKDWAWDGDQRQAAEEAYTQGQAALPPANEPAKDETEVTHRG